MTILLYISVFIVLTILAGVIVARKIIRYKRDKKIENIYEENII